MPKKRTTKSKPSTAPADKPQSLLPKKLIKRLGQETDYSLSVDFDIPTGDIGTERKRLGIKAVPLEWSDEHVSLLGTESDVRVADALGVTKSSAFKQRVKRGIPACHPSTIGARYKWTKRQIKMLGNIPDAQVAKKIGLDPSQVTEKRSILGIAPSHKPMQPRRKWTKKELARLGKTSDRAVGEAIGVHRHTVGEKRRQLGIPAFGTKLIKDVWSRKNKNRLGKVADTQLARELGVSVSRVRDYRDKLGIPVLNPRRRWTRAEDELLETMSDAEVGASLDRNVRSVVARRSRLGIAPNTQ